MSLTGVAAGQAQRRGVGVVADGASRKLIEAAQRWPMGTSRPLQLHVPVHRCTAWACPHAQADIKRLSNEHSQREKSGNKCVH
jgi:hypothetical protein